MPTNATRASHLTIRHTQNTNIRTPLVTGRPYCRATSNPAVLFASVLMLLAAGCGGGPADDFDDLDDGGVSPDVRRFPPLADASPAPDAPATASWQRERAPDGRQILDLALGTSPGDVVAVGRESLVVRRFGGSWQSVDADGLAALLTPYGSPFGDFHQVSVDNDGAISVTGGLSSVRGGVIRHPLTAGGEWTISYDEGDAPGVGRGPLMSAWRGRPCPFCYEETYAAWVRGTVVRRQADVEDAWGPWEVTVSSTVTDGAIFSLGYRDGDLFGVGTAIYRLAFDAVGSAWEVARVLPDGIGPLRVMAASSTLGTNGVAVGDLGHVYDFATDTFSRPTTANLWDVTWTREGEDGRSFWTSYWAVGAGGTVLRRDEADSWHVVTPPGPIATLSAVAVSADAIWVATYDGAIWRLDR